MERVDTDAEVSTGSGKVRLGDVGGRAMVKNSNGDNRVGRVRNQLTAVERPEEQDETAEVRARTSYGDIVIRRA